MQKHFLILAALLALMLGLSPVAAQTTVALLVWDNWTRADQQAVIDQLDQQFESGHPGVSVQREAYTSTDLAQMLPDALTQTSGPDVAMIDQSNLPALVKAGLLLPLNDYSDKYGWGNLYSQDLQTRNSIGGKLYGMSVTAEIVGMFYSKSIFSQLGLSVPVTWDDLDADLDAIKTGGLIPITFGNAHGSAGVDIVGALAYAYSDINDINALINRAPGAAFLTEGNLDAAQNFVDWIDKSYLSPSFATMNNDAALSEFTSGKSALWLTSSDNSATISAALGDQAGFFLLPSPIGDSVAPTVGGLGLAYGIRNNSANADLAAQYTDFITGTDTTAALLSIGILPATSVDASTLTDGTLSAALVNAWQTITTAGRVGQHFDAVLPNLGARIEALAAHQLDPEAFVNQVEQDYETGT